MRSRRLIAGLTLIVAIAVVIAIVLVTEGPSGSTPPADAAGGGGSGGFATVERRNLVQTDTESGTLSYASPQTVYNRLSGTITWLPSVGQVVHPGQALFRIDNEPVVLMNGATPAFRTLSSADTDGPDVLELNRNLISLGFNPDGIVADDVWQAATTAGVQQFQASLGESETGALTLGQVVFLPGPQLISTVDGTAGSTGGGGGGGSANASLEDPAAPHTMFVGLTTTTTTPTTTTQKPTTSHGHHGPSGAKRPRRHGRNPGSAPASQQEILGLINALREEIAHLQSQQSSPPASPPSQNNNKGNQSNNSSSNPSAPTGGGSPVEILQTTSTHLVVTVDLPASSQSEAVRGERVSVQMPAGNYVEGVVTAVSSVAQSSSNGNGNGGGGNGGGGGGGGSSATIPVTVRLLGHTHGAGLDQAAVSVSFAQARARHVLSVPVTALVATAGGGYAVQDAAAPHRLVPVHTGLFAAGYVQISGAGVYSGLQVTDSQG